MRRVRNKKGIDFNLVQELGYGGEGRVFSIEGNDKLVAKIYHDPIPEEKLEKLQIMTQMKDAALLDVAAWPFDILYQENEGLACGVLLPRIDDFEPLHILYNPSSRKEVFPHADWKFLLEVALNLAKVIGVIHAHGHTIGDVNSGNFVVGIDGDVHAIDCDSFQIISGQGKTYPCEVGVIEYTAPEIQGVNFSTIHREENHDRFALAVLIFQLLFIGRHPFAGVQLSVESSSLSDSIKGGHFAYGQLAKRRGIERPPLTPSISICGPEMAGLFEKAFSDQETKRPSCEQWTQAIIRAAREIEVCKKNDAHVFLSPEPACPWCAIEGKMKGRYLFPSQFDQVVPEAQKLRLLWEKIDGTTLPSIGPLDPSVEAIKMNSKYESLSYYYIMAGILFGSLAMMNVSNPGILLGFVFMTVLVFLLYYIRTSADQLQSRLSRLQDERASLKTDRHFHSKKSELNEVWTDLFNISGLRYQEALKLGAVKSELKRFLKEKPMESCGILNSKEIENFAQKHINTAFGLQNKTELPSSRSQLVSEFGNAKMDLLNEWRLQLESDFISSNNLVLDRKFEGELRDKVMERVWRLRTQLIMGYNDLVDLREGALERRRRNLDEIRKTYAIMNEKESYRKDEW